MTHFDGLKMRDPYHLLLAGNNDPLMEEGPAYVFNWRTGNLSVLAAGEMQAQGAHDIQWQPADLAKGEKAGLWRPNTHGFYLVDAVTGDVRETYVAPPNIFDDINHAQVLHDGPYAIVNSRLRDSFTKYDMTTGVAEWTVGGHAGTLDIVDLDGARVPKGHSVFFGQHNTEYFGDGEYMMFDNNFNSSTNAFVGDGKSRLLIVSVDETEKLATLVWELELEDQTCIYGDNDRLPTGNLLASAWPSVISADASFQYDARAFEVVRETKRTAWEAFVIGERCTSPADGSDGCVRAPKGGYPTGWSMYSVERFYDAPLVAKVQCHHNLLNFTAFNAFKMNGDHAGVAKVYASGSNGARGDAPLKTRDFTFSPHWRPTVLTVDLQSEVGELTGLLAVTNEWGDETLKHFSCS